MDNEIHYVDRHGNIDRRTYRSINTMEFVDGVLYRENSIEVMRYSEGWRLDLDIDARRGWWLIISETFSDVDRTWIRYNGNVYGGMDDLAKLKRELEREKLENLLERL